ncbi:alpha/beta fold hydrolase [Dipodascopsis uninucleata]
MASLYYQKKGEGTPVILLHGFGVDHRAMLPLEYAFEQTEAFERWYIDLPGMGQSASHKGVTGAQAVYDIVDRFISEHLAGRKYLIVGYSFGGMLARALANARSDMVLGICLICPEIIPESGKRHLLRKTVITEDKEFLSTLSEEDQKSFLATAVYRDRQNYLGFEKTILSGIKSFNTESIDAISRNCALSIDSESMSHSGPALMLLGRQDNIVGFHDPLGIVDNYPEMTVALLNGAGHTILVDKLFHVLQEFSNWVNIFQ